MPEDYLVNYFEQNILENLLKIELPIKLKIASHIKGSHKSKISGKNIEFKQHREYVQGDDVSKVDWKLFARSEKLFIKENEEDASCNALVVIDKSASMNYSSLNISKLEYAKYLFAVIFTAFTSQGDNVALSVFDNDIKNIFPLSLTKKDINIVNKKLNNIKAKGKTSIDKITTNLYSNFNKKIHMVFLISDMIDNKENILNFLKSNYNINSEIFVIHLIDPIESNFSLKGEYIFTDYETDEELIVDADFIAENFKKYFKDHFNTIREISHKYGCYYFMINTSLPYIDNFMNILTHYEKG